MAGEETAVAAAEQLEHLVGRPRKVTIAGKEIELRPPRPFGDEFPKILRLVAPIYGHFASETIDIADLLAEHGERIRPLCALLTNQDEEWLKTLEFDESIRLLEELVEVNLDFFASRLVPALARAMSRLSGRFSKKKSPPASSGPTADPGQTQPSG